MEIEMLSTIKKERVFINITKKILIIIKIV
jgi:hypothetical protein